MFLQKRGWNVDHGEELINALELLYALVHDWFIILYCAGRVIAAILLSPAWPAPTAEAIERARPFDREMRSIAKMGWFERFLFHSAAGALLLVCLSFGFLFTPFLVAALVTPSQIPEGLTVKAVQEMIDMPVVVLFLVTGVTVFGVVCLIPPNVFEKDSDPESKVQRLVGAGMLAFGSALLLSMSMSFLVMMSVPLRQWPVEMVLASIGWGMGLCVFVIGFCFLIDGQKKGAASGTNPEQLPDSTY